MMGIRLSPRTPINRAIIINTLVIPTTIYAANTYDPPANMLKGINKILSNFILSRTNHKIKRNTFIQPRLEGGIGLVDIDTKIRMLRITYINNIITHPEDNT